MSAQPQAQLQSRARPTPPAPERHDVDDHEAYRGMKEGVLLWTPILVGGAVAMVGIAIAGTGANSGALVAGIPGGILIALYLGGLFGMARRVG